MKGISTASNRLNPFRVHHLYTLRFVLSISHFKNHLLEKINSPDVDRDVEGRGGTKQSPDFILGHHLDQKFVSENNV